MLVADHQAQRARLERDAAAEHAAVRDERRIFLGIGRRIDEHGAFGVAEHAALANLLAEHGHFGEPRREQPAAAEAGGFAAAGDADFDVEAIAFLDARPQDRPAPARATCWARPALRWDCRRRDDSCRRAARPAAARAADRSRCPPSPVTSETASTLV